MNEQKNFNRPPSNAVQISINSGVSCVVFTYIDHTHAQQQ